MFLTSTIVLENLSTNSHNTSANVKGVDYICTDRRGNEKCQDESSIYKLMDTGRLNPRPLGTERLDLVSCYPKSDMIGNSSGMVLTNLISLLCGDLLSVLNRTFSIL